MKIKPHQYQHIANGIRRIKECLKVCDEPRTEVGTMFKKSYTHVDVLNFERFLRSEFIKRIEKKIDNENDKVLQSIINGDESIKGLKWQL
jgi:hypothetical protein